MPRSWPQTLLKWLAPFVPPPFRKLRWTSIQILGTSLATALLAILVSLRSLPGTMQCQIVAWLTGWYVATAILEVGAIYFMLSVFVSMYINLGERVEGELSAYSVFNRNWTRLTGTLTAEQLIAEQFGGAAFAAMPRLAAGNRNIRDDGDGGGGGGGGGGGDGGEDNGGNADGIEIVERVGRRRRPREVQEGHGIHDEAWLEDVNDEGGGEHGVRRRRQGRQSRK